MYLTNQQPPLHAICQLLLVPFTNNDRHPISQQQGSLVQVQTREQLSGAALPRALPLAQEVALPLELVQRGCSASFVSPSARVCEDLHSEDLASFW